MWKKQSPSSRRTLMMNQMKTTTSTLMKQHLPVSAKAATVTLLLDLMRFPPSSSSKAHSLSTPSLLTFTALVHRGCSEAISSVALLPHPFNMEVVLFSARALFSASLLQPEFFSASLLLQPEPCSLHSFSSQTSVLCTLSVSSSARTLSPAFHFSSSCSVVSVPTPALHPSSTRRLRSLFIFMLLIPACFFSFTALLRHADSSRSHGFSLVQSSSASSCSFSVLSLHAFTSSPHHTFKPSSLQHLWRQSRCDQPSLALCSWGSSLSQHGICIPVSLSFFIHIRFFSFSDFGDRLVPLFFLFIFIFSQVSSL